MQRRALLSTVGSLGIGSLAGCFDGTGVGDIGTGSTRTRDPPQNYADPRFSRDRYDAVARYEIGHVDGDAFPGQDIDQDVPIDWVVWNHADTARDLRVRVTTGWDERDLGVHSFEPWEYVWLRFPVPMEYALLVDGDGRRLHESRFAHREFDCNAKGRVVRVHDDWSVDMTRGSTLAGCPGVSVTNVAVDRSEGDCADSSAHRARIEYGGTEVAVDGRFFTPDPCHSVEVVESTYREDEDLFRVVLDAIEDDGACADCVGAVDYELTAGFEYSFPGHVAVVHRESDGDTEVARATWNADVDLGGSD
ncbi:hypothetical protein [Haloarchaeobius iranensis]|uniref:Uncharacterized protein n=1 Tax=Haloarchaeobius iranensis TaxID=996166 RepID=A0A1G9V0V6_9EURY|nr:hypothetical protein [Haloarchaeobius iranensis]SDM65842.1 hypothetical protein SAMN05192554_105127 [Haloarchaeobius iranensis]